MLSSRVLKVFTLSASPEIRALRVETNRGALLSTESTGTIPA
jgi:hypothetical protein